MRVRLSFKEATCGKQVEIKMASSVLVQRTFHHPHAQFETWLVHHLNLQTPLWIHRRTTSHEDETRHLRDTCLGLDLLRMALGRSLAKKPIPELVTFAGRLNQNVSWWVEFDHSSPSPTP